VELLSLPFSAQALWQRRAGISLQLGHRFQKGIGSLTVRAKSRAVASYSLLAIVLPAMRRRASRIA
jgi:hypothetical protein